MASASFLIVLRVYVLPCSCDMTIFSKLAFMATRMAIWKWKKIIIAIAASAWVTNVSFLIHSKSFPPL